jgi:predicted permease
MDSLVQDIRYAIRTLRRTPAFALVMMLTLAAGVGATTSLFSLVYAVVVNPFPFAGGDRMVNVRLVGKSGPPRGALLTAYQLQAFRDAEVIDDAIAADFFGMTMTGGDLPEFVRTQFYSSNALTFLNMRPIVGRIFTEADAPPGDEPPHIAVLTYGFWQRHFGARADVVGQVLHLDGMPYTVIGVAPPRVLQNIDVIVPIHLKLDPSFAWGVQTRLNPGVDTATAQAQLLPLFQSFAAETPARFPRDFRVEVVRFIDQRRAANFVPTLVLVFGAAAMLLLLACLTMSILLLARGASRQHEFAVRTAIGASRGRILQQLLTESLMLAAVGTALGIFVAYVGMPLVLRRLPPNALPLASPDLPISAPVLLFSASLAMLTALVFGLSPALSLSRGARTAALVQTGFVRIAGGFHSRRTHRTLIVVQVAMTVLLLAGSGAGVRRLLALYDSTLGYDPSNVLLVNAFLPEGSHEDWSERAEFIERLRSQISATPRVESVGLNVYGGVPPRIGGRTVIDIPGQTIPANLVPLMSQISVEYLSVLKIPLVVGRLWSSDERRRADGVAVINQTMARAFWPDASPIGQRFQVRDLTKSTSQFVLAAPGANGSVEVIGVVGDTPNAGLSERPVPAFYVPYTIMLGDIVTFMIRTNGDPLSLARSVREQVRTVDPAQAVTQITTAERVLADAGWARERFVVILLVGFGGFALALAAVGLFSVVSFAVSARVREFGIRLALGARRTAVVRLALGSTLISAGGGLAAGIVLSVAANTALARWSIGNLADPFVLTAVGSAILMTTVLAVVVPAVRAISIEPAGALRIE